MISVRLDSDLEHHLDRVARIQGVSRSEVVRRSIESYLGKYQRPSAWELGESLFGKHGSGEKERAKRSKEIMKTSSRRKWHG